MNALTERNRMNIDSYFDAVEARQMNESPTVAYITGCSAPVCTDPEATLAWTRGGRTGPQNSKDAVSFDSAAVRAAMVAKGINLERIAEHIGCIRSYGAKVIHDGRGNRQRVLAICDLLGLEWDEVKRETD